MDFINTGKGGFVYTIISRMDLYPWICVLYIEEKHRGNAYGQLQLNQAKRDVKIARFDDVYLFTNHVGYYEHYDFKYIANGYHPWGDISCIYAASL